jgi:hypothetical protein
MQTQNTSVIGAALNAAEVEAGKPVEVRAYTDTETVLHAFNYAVDIADKIKDPNQRKLALRRLCCGSIKRSKVRGVENAMAVQKLISSLGDVMGIHEQPNTGNAVFRFPVPQGYKAFTPMARVKDLVCRGGMFADSIHPCSLRKSDGKWEYKLHAPRIHPVSAEILTFVLSKDRKLLIEWFPGEDVTLWPASGDIGTQWVHLHVDLVGENIRSNRQP